VGHKDARLESWKSHRATQTQHAPYKAARVRSAGYSSQYDLEPRVPPRSYVSAPRRLAEDSLVHPRRTAALAHRVHGPAAPDWRGEIRVGRTSTLPKDRGRIPTACLTIYLICLSRPVHKGQGR
jgi:hypothetical protein